jgi:hypothetical protein
MALTLPELKQRLALKDADELLDLLKLDSSTIVEIASDLIEERYDELLETVGDIDVFSPDEYRA